MGENLEYQSGTDRAEVINARRRVLGRSFFHWGGGLFLLMCVGGPLFLSAFSGRNFAHIRVTITNGTFQPITDFGFYSPDNGRLLSYGPVIAGGIKTFSIVFDKSLSPTGFAFDQAGQTRSIQTKLDSNDTYSVLFAADQITARQIASNGTTVRFVQRPGEQLLISSDK